MTREDLSKLVGERPFTPFTIFLADGSNVRVSHPDALAVGNRTAVAIVPANTESGDTWVNIAIRHITKIERIESAMSGG